MVVSGLEYGHHLVAECMIRVIFLQKNDKGLLFLSFLKIDDREKEDSEFEVTVPVQTYSYVTYESRGGPRFFLSRTLSAKGEVFHSRWAQLTYVSLERHPPPSLTLLFGGYRKRRGKRLCRLHNNRKLFSSAT